MIKANQIKTPAKLPATAPVSPSMKRCRRNASRSAAKCTGDFCAGPAKPGWGAVAGSDAPAGFEGVSRGETESVREGTPKVATTMVAPGRG